jgi:hypothetical protein
LHALDEPVIFGDAPCERGLALLALSDVEHDADGAERVAVVVGEHVTTALEPVHGVVGPDRAVEQHVRARVGHRVAHPGDAFGTVVGME